LSPKITYSPQKKLKNATSNESKEMIDEHPKKNPGLFCLGCQACKKNAKNGCCSHGGIAEDPEKRPDFILFLGDNFI